MLNCLSSVLPDCLLDNKAPKLCVHRNSYPEIDDTKFKGAL